MKAMFQSDSLFIAHWGMQAIHPAVRSNESKKKTLWALAEDCNPGVTFKQYKMKVFTCETETLMRGSFETQQPSLLAS